MIRHLERLVPAAPDQPQRGSDDHPMRKVTHQVAFEPGGWTPERRTKVVELFDGLAAEWHTRAAPERLEPLADAVERGGPLGGRAVEVGSGTGLATPWLAERFPGLVAVDLSMEMLRRAPVAAAPRVCADAAHLPFGDGSFDIVVLLNMFLFGAEVDRLLSPDGALVWVNTSGPHTPIHLSAEEVDAALPGEWTGVASEAGWGTWSVHRRG